MNSKARMTFRFDNQEHKLSTSDVAVSSPLGWDAELAGVGEAGQAVADRPNPTLLAKHTSSVEHALETESAPMRSEAWASKQAEPAFAQAIEDSGQLEQLIRTADRSTRQRAQSSAEAYVELGELRKEQKGRSQPADGGRTESVPKVAGFSKFRPIIIDIEQEKPLASKVRASDKGPSWLKAGSSVALAIATGALFGYFILSLFSGYTDAPVAPSVTGNGADTTLAVTEAGAVAVQAPDTRHTGETTPAKDAEAISVQLNVPASDYYMLQFGVFSSEEGKQAAMLQLEQIGAAAAASTGDKFHVYAGMTKSKADAEALSAQLAGLEIYITKVTVPALGVASFTGDTALLEQFLLDTDTVLAALNQATVEQLLKKEPDKVAEASWQGAHQQWTRSASQLQPSLSGEDKAAVQRLEQSMNAIVAAFAAYNKNPSRSTLQAVQSKLMEAVLVQKAWIGSILTL